MRVSLTGEAELGLHKTVTELISLASFVKIVPSGHANNGPACSAPDRECQNNSYNKT